MKHEINLNGKLSTNMIDEINNIKIDYNENIYISKTNNSSTIYFKDITDENNYKIVKEKLKQELKNFILNTDNYLIIGLGNNNSNIDSLGPNTLNNIIVTNHLKQYGLDNKYKLVSKFYPNVTFNTGIKTDIIIKNLISSIKPNHIIIIDSLITNSLKNITKCIQITNTLLNSKINLKTKIPTLLIGIPTILQTDNDNIIITTKDIDIFISKASKLISESINEIIHN